MIKSNFYILLILISFLSFSQNEDCTSIYLIRHAEKVRDGSKNSNPHLNAKGILRADKWKDVLKTLSLIKFYLQIFLEPLKQPSQFLKVIT
jgi:broad specificity phosphatase PhoE